MGSKISKQAQNSDKNTETKSLGFDKMFVGCQDGSVLEFSMISKKIEHNFGKILNHPICSMAKTFDSKS